ncbi:ATP-binding protein [Streptomyces sp. MAR4 CNX-425]|uniref:ATP-binding protein n=1 Tax=Streptomyces sp. MAR4 CNX-425 TaxID=3406343 RepID=UPI003B51365F
MTVPGATGPAPAGACAPPLAQQRQFARGAASVARARDFAAGALTGTPGAGLAPDVRVCASELATNAVRYGPAGRDFLVRVLTRGDTVRLEVHDAGEGAPRVRTPDATEERGRGLLVVSALADEWGVSGRAGPGKVVWASFKVPRAAPRTAVSST